MFLDTYERRQLGEIIDVVTDSADEYGVREALAGPITRLMRADFLASFVWSGGGAGYDHRVAVNMDSGNLERYERYFQFRDPVTPKMATHHRAMIVDDVIDRRELERTEFYQDFLLRDGLHHGINFFAYRRGVHVGDLRLWRRASSRPFFVEDRMLLDVIGAILSAHAPAPMPSASIPARLDELLTARERQVALAVLEGLDDGQIGVRLHISYGTVRAHLGHIFEKWDVRSRMAMIAAARIQVDEFTDAPRSGIGNSVGHDEDVDSVG